MGATVGRERELEQVGSFLDPDGAAHVLLLEGEPGIGKTTVWEEGTAAAGPSWRVLRARPLEVEARISFAAVGDLLLGSLDEIRAELPGPQLHALEVALLLVEPGAVPPDPPAIAFAFLSSLRLLARSRPTLVAVDDVQWLDQPSAAVLFYAARRIEDEAVRFLLALRTEPDGPAADLDRAIAGGRLARVALGPLSRGAVRHLLHERLDVVVSRPTLHAIHAVSGGNPFFALELARTLSSFPTEQGLERLRIPSSLSALVDERLATLPPTTERALQIAAVLAQPTVDLVAAVLGRSPPLRQAVDAGVVAVDGDAISFTHPLLASGLAARIEPGRTRDLHRRIAAVVTDPEERARHLAQGAAGADPETVAALDRAAEHARRRGAPDVAAELLERALRLTTPTDPDRVPRVLATADAQRTAGDFARSRELATKAADALPPGEDRARALLALAEASPDPADVAAKALAEAGSNHALRARILLSLSLGYLEIDCRRALEHARSAVDDAEAAGDAALATEALANRAWFEGARCEGDPLASIRRAAKLERLSPHEVVTGFRPGFAAATIAMWRDQHEPARAGFTADFNTAAERGDSFRRMHALMHLAQVEWRAGGWARAVEHADAALSEWRESGDTQGLGAALWVRAVIAAHRGDLVFARDAVAEALAPDLDDRLHLPRHEWVLGLAHFFENDPQRALPHLEAAARGFDELGIEEPGMRLFTGDLIEAYVATGQVEEAAAHAGAVERRGLELGRPRAITIGLRGRGLAAAAGGDLEAGLDLLEDSIHAAKNWPVPLERGRTLLALGTVQRRLRRRREARATLQDALSLFEEIGAQPLLDRTRAELARIGGRAPAGGGLTPTERRVADLVATGKTNREVAAELVLSVHTVEAALTSVYRKLGLRSRSELAARAKAEQSAGKD